MGAATDSGVGPGHPGGLPLGPRSGYAWRPNPHGPAPVAPRAKWSALLTNRRPGLLLVLGSSPGPGWYDRHTRRKIPPEVWASPRTMRVMVRKTWVYLAATTLVLSLSAVSPAYATTYNYGQDPGLFHPCLGTPSYGYRNFRADTVACQGNGDFWTLLTEDEVAANNQQSLYNGQSSNAGYACDPANMPLFQDVPVTGNPASTYDEEINPNGYNNGGYKVTLNETLGNGGQPTSGYCSDGAQYDFMAYYDRATNSGEPVTDDGIVGNFKGAHPPGDNGNDGGPLPPPQNAFSYATINYNDFLPAQGQGQTDQAFADYGGIWGGCYNYIQIEMYDAARVNTPPPPNPIVAVWHERNYPVINSGCFNFVSLNGSALAGDTLQNQSTGNNNQFLRKLTNTGVSVNWPNIIAYLQGQYTTSPQECDSLYQYPFPNGGACYGDNFQGQPYDIPAYDPGAVTDVMGWSEQVVSPNHQLATDDVALNVSNAYLQYVSPDPNNTFICLGC